MMAYLTIYDDVSHLKIYEIINKYFGKNYTGWMKGWYSINEKFIAWFPMITDTSNPSKKPQKFSNLLLDDGKTIMEIHHEEKAPLIADDQEYYQQRLVFGRFHDGFRFLGVFKRSFVKEEQVLTYRYDRIAEGIDLSTYNLIEKVTVSDSINETIPQGDVISTNDSVWVAAAVISYEKYHEDGCRDITEFSLAQSAIRRRAINITGKNVEAARTSQWCCGSHINHTHPYLKETANANRRLAFPGEFGGEEIPSDIDERIEIKFSTGQVTIRQLIDFVREEYSTLQGQKDSIEFDKNMILCGPPGTGKTYNTVIYAVAICEGKTYEEVKKQDYEEIMARYDALKNEGRIAFTTFHQSYGYEEFIEGIKPVMDSEGSGDVKYTIEDGIFKRFCKSGEGISFDEAWSQLYEDARTTGGKFTVIRRTGSRREAQFTKEDVISVMFDGETLAHNDISKSKLKEVYETYDYEHRLDILNGGSRWVFDVCYAIIDLLVKKYNMIENADAEQKNRVFIIDEINRGNISKIFGELITLIEDTKRKDMPEAASAILPYSGEMFSVPANVHILGTMNTADRSIALMDTALRRRFRFVEMMPDTGVLEGIFVEGLNVAKMLEVINTRIEFLYDREHTIGHAFFMSLKEKPTIENLGAIFEKSVVPLLQEYFYEDYQKIQLVLGDNAKMEEDLKFIKDVKVVAKNIFAGNVEDVIDLPEKRYVINRDAFYNIGSYKMIAPEL